MSLPVDWDTMAERDWEAYQKRIEAVERILEEAIDPRRKKEEREKLCRDNQVSMRTLQNWLARYIKDGPAGLVFLRRRRPRSPRIVDQQLREAVLTLVRELPSRSVARVRRLLCSDVGMAEKIALVSDRSVYRFLQENGLSHAQRLELLGDRSQRAFHSFEAQHSMDLVQADARDGIWVDLVQGRRKTYLFLWVDDRSRKILFGKYYLDEKLPCLEDSFKTLVLRYGIPRAAYMDNGAVYISRQFASILAELGIRQIHHKPYRAWSKGKIEALQKTIKNEFQSEAARAGMRTLEELNSAFWAWAQVEYNSRIHSSTGEAPEERYLKGLPAGHRRIEDLPRFQAMFLWKEKRTVSKWGKISLYANKYPVSARAPKAIVQVRFDPFDLTTLLIYDADGLTFLETTTASKQVARQAPHIPQESQASAREVSENSVAYFCRLREKLLESQQDAEEQSFQKLRNMTEAQHEH